MGNYQIPKEKVEVTMTLQSGTPMDGFVFLVRDATGKVNLAEMLNEDEEPFFPFEHEDGGVSLISKKMVVYLKDDQAQPPETDLLPPPVEITAFFANGDDLTGLIYSDMPHDTLRASDYVNRKERFLVMYQGNQQVIFNRDQILYIND